MTSPQTKTFLDAWHHCIEKKDLALIDNWVTDDVVLISPALYRPKVGRPAVTGILRDVLASLNGYTITKTWIDSNVILLEFDAKVNEMSLQGIDRITLNADGKMTELKVYIRPYKGLQALIAAVVKRGIDRMHGPRKLYARLMFALKSRA